jgi:hypothetical protein
MGGGGGYGPDPVMASRAVYVGLIALTISGCASIYPQPFPYEGAEEAAPMVDPLTQARTGCWMKVENQKVKRNIDQRTAFVDKCVAEAMKGDAK